MTEVRICTNRDEWDEYVLEYEGHPLQLWGWGQVKQGHGWVSERLFIEDEDAIIGAAQVLIRRLPSPFRSFAYIPRGPICAVEHTGVVLGAITERVKRVHKSVALSVEPDTEAFEAPDGWVRSTNKILSPETILLDITKSESDLLAAMSKKTRQYIRKSSADVTIRQARSEDDLSSCLNLYKKTAQRAGFNLHSDAYYQDVVAHLRDHSPIFIAEHGGVPVAFLWLAISADTAYELYGGMNEDGQSLRANYALKWYAIRKVKEWGLSRYDFGGLVAGGVTTFKQGWASGETVLAGTFDRPLSPLYTLWAKGLPFAKKTLQKVRRRG